MFNIIKFMIMRCISFLTVAFLLVFLPVKVASQSVFDYLAFLTEAALEEESIGEYEYENITDERGYGHFYSTKASMSADVADSSNTDAGEAYLSLAVMSGRSAQEEMVRFVILCKDMSSGFGTYLKSLKNYNYVKSGMNLSIDMTYVKDGSDCTLDFSGAGMTVFIDKDLLIVDVLMANAKLSGNLEQRIKEARRILNSADIDKITFDGMSYSLFIENTSLFYKNAFDDMVKKIGSRDYGENSYNKSESTSASGSFSHSGTKNYYATNSGSYMSYLRETIDKYDECRTGAITKRGPGVVIWGTNGYAYNEYCHSDLKDALKDINSKNYTINDVAISESGKYVVIYGNNGYSYNGIPDGMANWVKKYHTDSRNITSVAFTDDGHWAIVTDKAFISDSETMIVLKEAQAKYGFINSVSLSGNSVVVCCSKGIYYKNAPKKLIDKLNDVKFLPKVIKITDDGLVLITDGDKRYAYFM